MDWPAGVRFVSTAQVAKWCRVDRRTLKLRIRQGAYPGPRSAAHAWTEEEAKSAVAFHKRWFRRPPRALTGRQPRKA